MAALHEAPIPFITLPNWVKAAAQCGFNVEPVFRELGIQTDLVHLESATVSVSLLEKAMDECVARARVHHFPFVLGETFAFDYLPDLQTFLTTSPTLREAARVFDWVRELINPLIRVRLVEQGATAMLVLEGAGAAPQSPRPYFDETLFASVVKFGRMLLQRDSDFSRLCLGYPPPPYADAYAKHFRMPVAFGQPCTGVEIERALLDRPLEGAYPALHQQAEYRVEQRLTTLARPESLAAQVEAACARRPALLHAGLAAIARELGMTPRTLQRRLQDEGRRYGDVLGRIQYRQALKLLEDPGASVEAVSEKLGFSDRRSFTRAFTRWSGVSPSAFLRVGRIKKDMQVDDMEVK